MSSPVFTPQASLDLENIGDYIARFSPRAAARFIRKIEGKCQTLAQFPEMGSPCEELAPGLRYLSVGNHVIFYRPTDTGVQIIRVVRGSRDLPTLFQS